jgi:hypothetical protein
MWRVGGIISWERLDTTTVTAATLAGKESKGSMAWCFELTVGHIFLLVIGSVCGKVEISFHFFFFYPFWWF